MLLIAICDDAPEDLAKASLLVKEYASSHDIEAQVTEFLHPDALLGACEKASFDLFLLDIIMPMFTGIDVGRELRRHGNSQIIYLTASDEFAVEAFAVQASNYLIKPIRAVDFNAAMDRALRQFKASEPKHFSVRSEGGTPYMSWMLMRSFTLKAAIIGKIYIASLAFTPRSDAALQGCKKSLKSFRRANLLCLIKAILLTCGLCVW